MAIGDRVLGSDGLWYESVPSPGARQRVPERPAVPACEFVGCGERVPASTRLEALGWSIWADPRDCVPQPVGPNSVAPPEARHYLCPRHTEQVEDRTVVTLHGPLG